MPNSRALHVMVDDVDHRRQQVGERHLVAGPPHVRLQRMEEPERRIRRVVQALVAAVGEHVRDQAVAHIVRERPQNERRLRAARPVVSVSPSRLIIVSRPQSVNQW